MKQKRKGSRQIDIGEDSFSYFVGKSLTEIRNLHTNKAFHVPNVELDAFPGDDTISITPGSVRSYIQKNILTRA